MFMEGLAYLLTLSFLGSVAGLIGGIIFLFDRSWAKALASSAVPFAAGVLLTVSFLDLLPEVVEAWPCLFPHNPRSICRPFPN